MERIENRMVRNSVWENLEKPCEIKEKLNGAGYVEIGTGNFVSEEDAFDYALERCLHGTEEDQREFKEMLVEWFYSGNWVYEDGEFEHY